MYDTWILCDVCWCSLCCKKLDLAFVLLQQFNDVTHVDMMILCVSDLLIFLVMHLL
jgi:hypothetical protein